MPVESDAKNDDAPRDPVRRWTLIVLGLIVVLFLYSLIADRLTPYTSQATVQAFVVRMAPEVAGRVIEVNVVDNQRVKAGDVLFRIDPQPFAIALQQAEAKLAGVGQSIGASTAAVSSAQERLIEAKPNATTCASKSNRILELVEKGVYAKAQGRSGHQGNRSRRSQRARGRGRARARPPGARSARKRQSAISRGPRCGRAGQARSRSHHDLGPFRRRHHQSCSLPMANLSPWVRRR